MYFDSFGNVNIPQEASILSKIKDKSTIHNIFRMHDDDSIMCVFYCFAFIVLPMGRTNMVKESVSLVFRFKKYMKKRIIF